MSYAGRSILEIDTFDAVGDTREDLVGDRVELIAELGDGQMLAEDLHLVALLTGDVGDIDHRHIHTDVTHVLGLLPVHQTVTVAVAQMTVESVGMANGDSGNDGIALDLALAAVADRLEL